MKKLILFFIFLINLSFAQTLVQTVPFPNNTYWNAAYGLAFENGKFWISSSSTAAGNRGILYSVDSNGNLVDTVNIVNNYPGINASQGLAFDGEHFWYVERKTARCDLFKVSRQGVVLDSIPIATAGGTTSWILGGAAWDGTGLWVSLYSPDAAVAIYKIDVNTKTIVDTIPTIPGNLQPTGVAVKGDTLFYANDGFNSNGSQGQDRIFAVSKTTKDTLFTFRLPHSTFVQNAPRGLAWDGTHFWLMARPVGASTGRVLFKYQLEGSGNPGISLLTTQINFGNVQVDTTVTGNIFINNFGTANLSLDSIRISNPAFVINQKFPMTVTPGQTVQIPVAFTPTQFGSYVDSVLIFHNDVNFEFSKVRFLGNGIYTAPYLSLSETALNFGNKRFKSTSYKTLEISNLGSHVLMIDSLKLGTENYWLVSNENYAIDSVSKVSFDVWFNPDAYATFNDTLTLFTNASNGAIKKIPLTGNGAAFDSTLGNIFWQGIVPNNPRTSFNDLSAKYIKPIEDLNGDGVGDIIVATDNYYTIAYNGNSSGWADILWKFSSFTSNNNAGSVSSMQTLQIASDLDGDGIQDVVIGTGGGNEFVYAISGATGNKIWEYGDSVNFNNGDIMGVDVSRDFTSDGIPDVLVSASGNESGGQGRFSMYLVNGATGQEIWRINQASQQKLKYGIVSTDEGGAVGSRVGTVNEVIGFNKTGDITWTYPTNSAPWAIAEIPNIGGDPGTDIIVGDTGGRVYAISGDAGVQIWQRHLANIFIDDIIIIPDINGNGTPDIIVDALTSTLWVIDGGDGSTIWQFGVNGTILGAGLLGDLNADDQPEIGTATLNNAVTIFDSRNGSTVYSTNTGGGGNSTAAEMISILDDIDRNGSKEFVVGTRDGRVIAYSGGTDVITSLSSNNELIPGEFNLYQNYPNPFNPSTVIQYSIPFTTNVKLTVYDILGREVITLINSEQQAGYYKLEWNGTNKFNNIISSGVYFYTLEAGDILLTKKMQFLK